MILELSLLDQETIAGGNGYPIVPLGKSRAQVGLYKNFLEDYTALKKLNGNLITYVPDESFGGLDISTGIG